MRDEFIEEEMTLREKAMVVSIPISITIIGFLIGIIVGQTKAELIPTILISSLLGMLLTLAYATHTYHRVCTKKTCDVERAKKLQKNVWKWEITRGFPILMVVLYIILYVALLIFGPSRIGLVEYTMVFITAAVPAMLATVGVGLIVMGLVFAYNYLKHEK